MTDQPKFRIQTVAEMTGVHAVTLRAWERRYGVPRPVRTESAYRQYTPADVQQIQRMLELCESGLSTSEAAKLVRERGDAPSHPAEPDRDAFGEVATELFDAVCTLDGEAMDQLMRRALTLGSTSQIFERAVVPVMVQVGEQWHAGKLSVAHEHFATQFFQASLSQMHRLVQPAAPRRTAVLACFPDELHGMPLYGVAFRLADWGCRTAMLGPLTPPVALAAAVKTLQPQLVALSVTVPPKGAKAREIVEGYALACGDTPWLVGGGGTPALGALVSEFGGIVAPSDPNELHSILEQVLTRRSSESKTK